MAVVCIGRLRESQKILEGQRSLVNRRPTAGFMAETQDQLKPRKRKAEGVV